MKYELNDGWQIFQDVHDSVEKIGIESITQNNTDLSNQVSEWEELPRLCHLQLLFSDTPHYGWQLRQFNHAPWWYRKAFHLEEKPIHAYLTFTNVDYFCKVYMNGVLLGEHEGYSDRFSWKVDEYLQKGENVLLVKVWSPWDDQVEQDREDYRAILIRRNMVKGTYEHSDGLLQRDVNPVGIYGSVTLMTYGGAHFASDPQIIYRLNSELDTVALHISCVIAGKADNVSYRFSCRGLADGATVCSRIFDSPDFSCEIERIDLWNTWDRGQSCRYSLCVELLQEGKVVDSFSQITGFRRVEMVRTKEETILMLNGKRFYVRGTSYFPDQYISAMSKERYLGDLIKIREAGFNFVRVHVHTEQQTFYDLCDELGVVVMQDSEFNWVHPFDENFTVRFINIFTKNIEQLRHHPSIIIWAGLNEPGMMDLCRNQDFKGFSNPPLAEMEINDPYQKRGDVIVAKDIGAGYEKCRAMEEYPGPQIWEAIRAADDSRPIIKGSFCRDDLESGDSHNYFGSLSGEVTHYLDIYNSREKLNTEFGFDAPPTVSSLQKEPQVFKRLQDLEKTIPDLQNYQYQYLKYAMEHYRIQKYAPCSGYVQFLFSDTSPVSYYGIYDYYGLPKACYKAMKESNMPLAVMLKYGREELEGIYVANDTLQDFGVCEVRWTLSLNATEVRDSVQIRLGPDQLVRAATLHINYSPGVQAKAWLQLFHEGKCIARNAYQDLFAQPRHPHGHPGRISNGLGCRIYNLK